MVGENGSGEKPQIVAELKITMDTTGHIEVEGPLDQQTLCYGLLETCRDVVLKNWLLKSGEGKVLVPGLQDRMRFGQKTGN